MNRNDISNKVTELINKAGRSPFLFLGSGFSRRYLETEDWEGLLRSVAARWSDDEYLVDKIKLDAPPDAPYGVLPYVASVMEQQMRHALLEDRNLEKLRDAHKEDIRSQRSLLKVFAADHLKEKSLLAEMEPELRLLKEAGKRRISGVITTNYDTLAETVFPGFKTYASQDDLLFQETFELAEIYKIHGSIENPESMVLLEKDYRAVQDKQQYLVAKLLTIFAEYPLVFIGYSLTDPDIKSILRSLAQCVGTNRLAELRDRFIFVTRGDNEVSKHVIDFDTLGNIELTRICTSDYGSVYDGIAKSECVYSPRVLRRLRRDIYELVEQEEPADRLIVVEGFDSCDDLPEDASFVIGVGTVSSGKRQYANIPKAEILYLDAVLDNQQLSPKLVVDEYLPHLLKSNSGGLPMFKYLSVYDNDGNLDRRIQEKIQKATGIDSFLNNDLRRLKKNYRAQHGNLSVMEIIRLEGEKALGKICFLEPDEINVAELKVFLRECVAPGESALKDNSELKRLIRIYDYLKYKMTPDKSSTSAYIEQTPGVDEGGR